MMIRRFLPAALLLAACFVSAFPSGLRAAGTEKVCAEARELAPADYSKKENWIMLPDSPVREVDVFFVYPTVVDDPFVTNMDWRLESHRVPAQIVTARDTGMFQGIANVYAPFYRQLSMASATGTLKTGNLDTPHFQVGFRDVEAAFLYYMEHWNNGRPLILLGHSQGSSVLLELMKKHFGDRKYSSKLVAAYLPGWHVTQAELDAHGLKFAQGAEDIGVIALWNSQTAECREGLFCVKGGLGINPLNWKRDPTPAPASLHRGTAIWKRHTSELKQISAGLYGARLVPETGGLIVEPSDTAHYGMGSLNEPQSLHRGDIAMFYVNIRENALLRIGTYFKNAGK